jgi:hypothetical protein
MNENLASNQALMSRTDLHLSYGRNARLLFALQTKFQIEDIDAIAAECLTCGPDDRKCDLIYVNSEDGYAVVAQAYESDSPCKESAPSNKASDLNTAMAWLLNNRWQDLPDQIQSAAEQFQDAINRNLISRIYIWYVHNCNESGNVQRELENVERSANASLRTNYPNRNIEIQAVEIGKNRLEEWYQEISTPILVSETIHIENAEGYEITGKDWSAYVAAVPAKYLYTLFRTHQTKLFSANIRDYLGSRESDKNINNNIKRTAETEPEHFWIYNNGLTALVNDYDFQKMEGRNRLTISGISIVNGAQTTGAIGSLEKIPDDLAFVPIRFVKCHNQDVVFGIIRYNNSQNKIKASDFRSNDLVQSRLREEFEEIPDSKYYGGRRGSAQDIIRRTPDLLPSDTVAQTIASFHGNPTDAYNKKADLWEDDSKYADIFNDKLHAPHIVFVYSLLRCIEDYKIEIRKKDSEWKLLENEKKELGFLRNRGATFLLHAAIAHCVEIIVNRPIPNKFVLSFGKKVSPDAAKEMWRPIVRVTVPFCSSLESAVHDSLQNKEEVKKALDIFRSYVAGLQSVHAKTFNAFASTCSFVYENL